jgi:hypothetical protein
VVSICTAGCQQEKREIEGAMKCEGYKGGMKDNSPPNQINLTECVRISTGAKVPDWTDAVVPVEETTILEDDVSLGEGKFVI